MVDRLERRELMAVSISQYPTPLGNSPQALTNGPEGDLWFAGQGTYMHPEALLGSITPITHMFTEYTAQGFDEISSLTTGPDGNLWFTGHASNMVAVGSFNPTTQAVESYPLGPLINTAGSITAAPDGNLWFTETLYNYPSFTQISAIGSINPTTHAISSYTIPGSQGFGFDLTLGPDGNLWFTNPNTPEIGVFNITTHAITEIAIPSSQGAATAITTGADGNLWFTTATGGIGSLNPTTQAVSEFALPQGASGSITAGPSGDLWFTDGNQIGAFDPTTDQASYYGTPDPATDSYGITAGPDNTVWFADFESAQLGEAYSVPGSTTTTLYPSPNPVPAGANIVLTATITPMGGVGIPTGTVTFYSDGARVGTAAVNANGQAIFVISTFGVIEQGPGADYSASYSGDTEFANSLSTRVTVYFTLADGPQVQALQWFANNGSASTVVLAFNEPLYAPKADLLSNYKLTNYAGRKIALSSAVYSAAADTVTLKLSHAVGIHQYYNLTVLGTTPLGLTDLDGRLLDGGYTGYAGSNFVATLAKNNLVIAKPAPRGPAKHTAATHHATKAAKTHATALHRR